MGEKLDYSDSYTINVSKVKFNGKFTHWEGDLSFSNDGWYCGVTAPTMGGVIDELLNYLYEVDYQWTKEDANEIK